MDMYKRYSILLFLIAFFMLLPVSGFAQEMTARFSKYNVFDVYEKSQFKVKLELKNFPRDFDPEKILSKHKYKGCKLLNITRGMQSENTIITGDRVQKHVVTTYLLTFAVEKKGIVSIGPVDFDGVKSNKLNIAVNQAGDKNNRKAKKSDFFLKPVLSSSYCNIGREVVYELRLLYSDPQSIYDYDITPVKGPDFNGVSSYPSSYLNQRSGVTEYNGVEYYYAVVGIWVLSPEQDGNFKVGAGEYRLKIIPPMIYSDPFFGPQYSPDYGNAYELKLKVDPLKLKVEKGKNLPQQRDDGLKNSGKPKRKQDKKPVREPQGPVYRI